LLVVTKFAEVRPSDALLERIQDRSAAASVIGLGYVGLPLAAAIARAGFRTRGFDTDPEKQRFIGSGRSYIDAVTSDELADLVRGGRLDASTDFSALPDSDIIVICVPTPLTRQREPDLHFVETTARTIAKHLRRGQLIVLESTTWPGTTEEVVKPILESTGMRSGSDFFLGFSPEREDPGNRTYATTTIPKVVAGDGADALGLMQAFYACVVKQVVPVSSPATAEAVKVTENIFRAVNIALVNELKVIYDAMNIDVWEVIEAAKTKPFGYMPFYPGPGLGGHCIPIDPFYLTWKAREFGIATRFIELAGEINVAMPKYVIGKLEEALDRRQGVSLGSAHILVVGLAYKKNVADIRESPALKIIELLEKRGARVDYLDPHVPVIPATREHPEFAGRQSVDASVTAYDRYNAVLICTEHDQVDYQSIFESARLIVDTRNVIGRLALTGGHVVKA
jgi:UDP-N-acetyl-D-glucosamine dehydrogenase